MAALGFRTASGDSVSASKAMSEGMKINNLKKKLFIKCICTLIHLRYGQCQIYGFAATPRPSNFVYATACETVGNCQVILSGATHISAIYMLNLLIVNTARFLFLNHL